MAQVRCIPSQNSSAWPLKTSPSAGIPGYIYNYLDAKKDTLKARSHNEVDRQCDTFLLSDLENDING
jgi:hypothetical protein